MGIPIPIGDCSIVDGPADVPIRSHPLPGYRAPGIIQQSSGGFLQGPSCARSRAAVHCLHCPEMAPPFLGTWYLLGMALPAIAGAMLDPRLLRW